MSNPKVQDPLVPKWVRDMIRLLPIRSQFILSGNIDDIYLYPCEEGYALLPLQQVIWRAFSSLGFALLVRYNPVDGISLYPDAVEQPVSRGVGITLSGNSMPVTLDNFLTILRRIVNQRDHRIAVLVDYASRIPVTPSNLTIAEHQFFVACDKLARDAAALADGNGLLFNPIIWRVVQRSDLPVWFMGNNNRIVMQEVERPNQDQRLKAAALLLPSFEDFEGADDDGRTRYARIFADMTDAMTLRDMQDMTQLSKSQQLPLADIDDVVRSYKTGDQSLDNPWRGEGLKKRLETAEDVIRARVKGQEAAIESAMDILKRSVLGLTGAHRKSAQGQPRGVLFLAGPTGVGKTELAKALTESVFGDEQAYIRFDMSEFAAEHSDQRLLGAPPSYVGFEKGGELTNAIRSRPFSLVLFDEIEKAHPRILDKFLQILEDGRLTDGRGETVYFSESIIVFTSNLGIIGRDEQGNATRLVKLDEPYAAVREKVLTGIKDHFTFRLGRPEILNRLGDNIVVFDFIRGEVAKNIFEIMIANIQERVRNEHHAELDFSESVHNRLLGWSTKDLRNGGRGIGSCLENILINPLARALFQVGNLAGRHIMVSDVDCHDHNYIVKLEVSE